MKLALSCKKCGDDLATERVDGGQVFVCPTCSRAWDAAQFSRWNPVPA